MSRGLSDQPEEPAKEQPEPMDIMQMIYALGMFLEDVEKKVDEMNGKLDKLIEQ